MKVVQPVLMSALALLALLGAGCTGESKTGESKTAGASPGAGGRPQGGRAGAAFPVEVVPVSTRAVEYTVTAVGSVEAFEIVQVTARVPGAVERVHFREGSTVKQGDMLVEIEPERYRLAVEEARAAVEKARAGLAEAEAGLARRDGANKENAGLIPGEEIDAWRTRVRTARAEVTAQEAGLQQADRNMRDAQVRSPFAGIIQTRDVQTGQYVQPGTLLSTLVRRDPLLLRFQVPEGDATSLSPGMTSRFRVSHVQAEHQARIIHVAESADLTSRMVAVTAEIVNPADILRPGAFAEVTVPIGSSKDSPVIPETAVRPSERGFLAFVIDDGKAHERVLTLGLRTADGLVEVKDGLAAAESLVVRGAEGLREGARVRVVAPGGVEASAGGPKASEKSGS
jgi:membrane fusion protein, multidrug efflux system